jgi:subtilisin family serine protease
MRFMNSRRRHTSSGGDRRNDRVRGAAKLAAAMEALERRSMLAANVLDVTKVLWNGKQVEAVRNEYVFRMPQTNAATAKSIVDYAHRVPVAQKGWSVQGLGSGFYKLTAPGATQATVTNWARQQGAQSINVNATRSLTRVPNDPLYATADNWAFPQIDAPDAWETATGTRTTIAAVVDTGVDYNHPDLAANMWRNPNEVVGDGIDNDRNGVVDDVYGFNAITGTGDPMDDNGHGTFCSGFIGAVGNNAVGLAGANWSTQIMAIKIFDANGATSIAAEVRGIQYIIDQKVRGQGVVAANLSYGGYQFVQQEFDALNQLSQAGVVIVAAAGNDANNNDVLPAYPASYNIPGLISVAASTTTDNLAIFSNYGVTTVDLAAPGVNVLSTRAAQASPIEYPFYNGDSNYSVSSGTSFAAPLVTGAAVLLKSIKPAASIDQVKTAILGGVDRVPALNGLVVTGGRLNLANSVDLILATAGSFPVPKFVDGQSLSFVEGNKGYTLAEIRVELDRPCDPGKSASVYYTTQPGGSAFPGLDYVATNGYVTFSGPETKKSFFIKLVGDRQAEQAERFAVQLLAAKSRGIDAGTTAVQQVNISILDDDYVTDPTNPGPTNPGLLPVVGIDVKREAADPNAPGGPTAQVPFREGGVATFVVSLDRTSAKTVSVKYRTNQPSLPPAGTALENVDYKATSGTITFRPGERTKEITVPVLADKVTDPNESFRVVLSEPINAEFGPAGVQGRGSAIDGVITDVGFVPPPTPGSSFQITLSFPDNSLTMSQQAVFRQAANRWEEIIIGDLPDVTDPATGQVIDDILILATGRAIDGAGGILGAASPTETRPAPDGGALGMPWKGEMFFDSADLATMENNGMLKGVILHEMAHVLAFGTFWQQRGLVRGWGTADPTYVGANALREYRTIFGLPAANSVPLENTGGPGTANSHWRETVFAAELMTGYAEMPGTAMPISRITVGALQDLGYQVNYAKADPYARPVALVAPPAVRVNAPAFVRGRPVSVARPSTTRTAVQAIAMQQAATATSPVAAGPKFAVGSAGLATTNKSPSTIGSGINPAGFAALARS